MLLPICSGQMHLAEVDAWSFVSSPPPEAESCPYYSGELRAAKTLSGDRGRGAGLKLLRLFLARPA